MFFYRYSAEGYTEKVAMSYSKIARRLYLPVSTVYQAIRRYESNKLRYVDRRRLNFQKCWPDKVKIKGALKDYLLSYEVLSSWAPYSLE